jgi:Terminase RNaseH-like domain
MTQQELQEIKKCKNDYIYFAEKYLKIINKKNRIVPLKLNSAQKSIYDSTHTNRFIKILKARQLGSSTFIASFFFWKSLFKLNERTLVIAHQHESVKSIFRIYKTYYDNLPSFLKFKTTGNSANALEFETGSFIKVGSASSEAFRGISAISNLHLSEVAFWDTMKDTISSVFQTTGENPYIILETSPNSLNDFFQFWSEDNGYEPVFLSWNSDENNTLDELSSNSKRLVKDKPEILSYLQDQSYTDGQIKWAVETFFTKTAGDISRFKQEYAIDPISCFITSGDKFFSESFILMDDIKSGYIEYQPPKTGHIYSIGVDTSGGSATGDYSAFCVMDITDKQYPKIVATYYDRQPVLIYAERVLQECKKYEAYAVIEKNSYGLAVIEYLVSREYTFIYTKTLFDKVENRFKDEYGFYTNQNTRPLMLGKLQDFINNRKILIEDKRLQAEINAFIYDKGKPQAQSGKHDDLVMATALALMSLEQYEYVENNRPRPNPKSPREWLELEVSLGMPREALINQGIISVAGEWKNESIIPQKF